MTSTRHDRAASLWPVAIAGLGVLAYLGAEVHVFSGQLGFPLDDGWIHLRFARRLADGGGLTFNPGRWVGGSTAPLWTALLAPGFLLPGGAVVWAKLLGAAFFLAAVDATARLAGELGLDAGARRLAAVLVATTPWLVWSALSGMEVTLFTALSLWGLTLHLRERRAPAGMPVRSLPVRSLPVLALAGLARPEGWLLVVAALADRALRFERREDGRIVARPGIDRRWLQGLAGAAVVLVPCFVVYRVLGGSFLPTTFAVKSGLPVDAVPSGRHLARVLDVLFASQPVMLVIAGAGALRLVERLGGARDRGLLPVLWPVGLALAKALMTPEHGPSGVGNFGRYYFPLLPLVAVLGVLGLDPARRRLGRYGRLGIVAVALLPQLWGLSRGPLLYTQTLANAADSDLAAARWLDGRLPSAARLAAQDIGALGYHLPNPVLDLTGIVNPEILAVLHGGGSGDPAYWEDRLLAFLAGERPDYLVVFPDSYPRIAAHPGFEIVRTFPVPRNIAMAGDELAILSTPWTAHPLRSERPPAPSRH